MSPDILRKDKHKACRLIIRKKSIHKLRHLIIRKKDIYKICRLIPVRQMYTRYVAWLSLMLPISCYIPYYFLLSSEIYVHHL